METSDTRTQHTKTIARRLVDRALAAIGPEAPAPTLQVLTSWNPNQQSPAPLVLAQPDGRWTVGRGSSCDLVLDDPDVTREHARVRRDGARVFIADLNSKNGVQVAGRPIVGEHLLCDGDALRVGGIDLHYRDPAQAYLRSLKNPDAPNGPSVVNSKTLSVIRPYERLMLWAGFLAVAVGAALIWRFFAGSSTQ